MDLRKLKKNWEAFGKEDPYWAILTHPKAKNNKWDLEDFFKSGEHSIAMLKKRMQQHGFEFGKGRAMDFGCGVGRCTLALADYFDQVDGVDISSEMLTLAKTHIGHRTNVDYFEIKDASLSQFDSESYDFIHTVLTLQHVNPRYSKEYIKRFIDLLKPAGLCYLQIPSKPPLGLTGLLLRIIPGPMLNVARKIKYGSEPVMEMHWISKSEIEKIIRDAGASLAHYYARRTEGGFESSWYFIKKNA